MCSIIKLATIAFNEHLVIGQRQKAPNFSAFHWSAHGCLITIGQHFVTMRIVHLPKRTVTSLITESDQSRANYQLLQRCTVRTAWSESDQAVRAVHSCKSWLRIFLTSIKSPPKLLHFAFDSSSSHAYHNFINVEENSYVLLLELLGEGLECSR